MLALMGNDIDDSTDKCILLHASFSPHVLHQGIDLIHATTGMPYWATIVALTFALRCALLPLAFGTMRNAGKNSPRMGVFSVVMYISA